MTLDEELAFYERKWDQVHAVIQRKKPRAHPDEVRDWRILRRYIDTQLAALRTAIYRRAA